MEEKKEDSFEKQELLIDKKIAEAKFEVVEKRNQFLLWFFGIMLAIAGVAIPLLLSFNTQDRADKEIENMKSEMKEVKLEQEKKLAEYKNEFREEFKDIVAQQNIALSAISNSADKTLKETKEQVQALIGQQLAKPELTLRINGSDIAGKTIDVSRIKNLEGSFDIYNKGKATAKNISFILYVKQKTKLGIRQERPWFSRGKSDEPEFDESYYYMKERWNSENLGNLDPGRPSFFDAGLYIDDNVKELKEDVLIKIFYGQPEPTKIFFTLEMKK